MEFPNKLLLCQCAAYFLGLLLSLFVVTPLAKNSSQFGGRCLLFSDVYWRDENVTGSLMSRLVVQAWGPPAACHFCTFVGVFTLVFSAAQAWRTLFYLCKGHDDTLLSAFLNLVLSCSVLFLTLVASVMISVGFSVWCDMVTNHGRMPQSCEEMQSMNLHVDVDTSSFYIHFRVAQFGLWSVWLVWAVLGVLSFLKVYRNYKRQELARCLAREKELLLDHSSRCQPDQQQQQRHHHHHHHHHQAPSVFI